MTIVTIENVSKSYGEKSIFHNISLNVEAGEKIGLVGVNGAGKSTLIKIIAGVEPADAGIIRLGKSAQVEYLPQEADLTTSNTVLMEVFKGNTPVMQTLGRYEELLYQNSRFPDSETIKQQLLAVSQEIDLLNGWQIESDAKNILTKLGITDFAAQTGSLSGGQRKRIALASALINPCELLILDEPTNHLDGNTVSWLEQILAKRKGALLMITHDRYFLDRVASRMIELDKGKLYSYTGNYTQFLELKAIRIEQQEASERKRQKLLKAELAWMRRGAKARTTKQKARIDRFEQLTAQKADLPDNKLEITTGSSRLGKTVIELENIHYTAAETSLIANFSYTVLRNDRVGIIGPNGCGKSTLLDIFAGKLAPQQGIVTIGQTVKIGYFSQTNQDMDDRLRVIEYIREEANYLTAADGTVLSASQMLELFLFPPALQWTPVAKLSGGEKRRLYLLRILMSAPNVLILDEPTNDLDLEVLGVLEEYIENFPGAVIFASHDRYFLDRLAEKTFVFHGLGHIQQYPGGYSDYYETVKQLDRPAEKSASSPDRKPLVPTSSDRERAVKLSFKEQREYDEIEAVISSAEGELKAVCALIDKAGSNFELLQDLVKQEQELRHHLEQLYDRWTYLEEIASQGR